LDTYLFADATASVSRAQQEDQFKIFNQTVLRTDPTSAQRELIEGWYGDPNLPANAFNGGFVPEGWLPPNAPANATQLCIQAVAPSCRACQMIKRCDKNTVPQIFINNHHIGGHDDLVRLNDNNQLDMLLGLTRTNGGSNNNKSPRRKTIVIGD
jgi:hypothetical protein